jgi:hypothetical protein
MFCFVHSLKFNQDHIFKRSLQQSHLDSASSASSITLRGFFMKNSLDIGSEHAQAEPSSLQVKVSFIKIANGISAVSAINLNVAQTPNRFLFSIFSVTLRSDH